MSTFFKGAFVGGVGAALVMAATAALAGTGIGGVFNLGVSNTVDAETSLAGTTAGNQLHVTNNGTAANAGAIAAVGKSASYPALRATNTGGGPAGGFYVNSSTIPPFVVNSSARVAGLTADRLDGLDSSQFLRNRIPLSLTGAVASDVIRGTNTGSGNGLQGSTGSLAASGVYGANTSGGSGYGVAGRATGAAGIGVYGDNSGGGWAGWFNGPVHLAGSLDCAGCVGKSDLEAGATNVPGYEVVYAQSPNDNVVRTERSVVAECPPGKLALGGGGWTSPHPLATTAKAAIVASEPARYIGPNGTEAYGWYVQGKAMQTPYNTSLDVGAYAICARVSMQ